MPLYEYIYYIKFLVGVYGHKPVLLDANIKAIIN